MTDSTTTMDDSTLMEMIPEGSNASLDSACKTESQTTVFNVVYQAVPLEESHQNGPITNNVDSEEVSVSFTLNENGVLGETKSEVRAEYQLNGCNGMNVSEEDFEFIDGPADDTETPKSSCATPKTPDKSLNCSTVETFTLVDRSTLPANDIDVTVNVPFAQMNGPMVNGIGSSTDSDKLDFAKTNYSTKTAIAEGIDEITEGFNSLKIHDKSAVELSNKVRNLTLADNKLENTESDKHKDHVNSIGTSQNGVTANEARTLTVKSEIVHEDRPPSVDCNSGVLNCQSPTLTHENLNTQENMNKHHIHSNSVNNQPSSAKRNRSIKEIQKEGQHKSVNTLRDRYHPNAGECSIESCLHQFTAAELLTGNNKFGCKNCTKMNNKHNPNKGKRITKTCEKTFPHHLRKPFNVTLFIIDTCKQILWQTVKTQLKSRIMRHFIRVCTVCRIDKNTS